MTDAEKKLRINLALAARILSGDGHDDLNQGQVSARLPGRSDFFIKRAIVGFNEAEPDDMIVAQVDPSQPIDRDAPPELPLHQAIYAARPDVNAIVHSHAPHTLVFGATNLELKPLSHDGACFQGRVARFSKTSQTVLSIEVGAAIAGSLGEGAAVLMQNHGGLVVAPSVREVAILSVVLERACRLQLYAESTGIPYQVSRADDVDGKQAYIYSRTSIKTYWDHAVRRMRREQEDVARWIP